MNDNTEKLLSEYFGEKAQPSAAVSARLSTELQKAEKRSQRRTRLAAAGLTILSDFVLLAFVLVFAGELTAIMLTTAYVAVTVLFSGILALLPSKVCGTALKNSADNERNMV